ncbi:Retrovirus-related Pol polyprotein from transposon opus-like Protein [Tribolium castaneum]|uniref:RNA-directed DNA polymerase n=1 Tax=Tribolium castaneum TaxID=7070 RepID=D7EKC6_TRICA|nr:Retrovirus-related Pol polyprotein from transposon opus-like Protein [Tribolium castaneum]
MLQSVAYNKPIAFYSNTLNSAEKNYSTIERELLAIVESTKHFRPYLYGKHFEIETDHKPIVWLFSDPNSRFVKWRLRSEEDIEDYTTKYKKGKENSVADALYKIEINIREKINNEDLDLISIIPQVDDEEILTPNETDELLTQKQMLDNPSSNETQHTSVENPVFTMPISEKLLNHFTNRTVIKTRDLFNISYTRPFKKHHHVITLRKGPVHDLTNAFKEIINPKQLYGIYFAEKEIEPIFRTICSQLFDNILQITKCNILCRDLEKTDQQNGIINDYPRNNHNGITETYNHLKQIVYWPDMKTKINKIINECETCLQSKYERHPYQIPFSGPLLAKKPFEVIHVDTFRFDNNKFITIIDLFSKYTQAYFVEDLLAITILNKLRHYFAHHNYPTKIVCDGGKEFKNNVLQEFCKLFKINLHLTTNYNPSSNSPIERIHSTFLEKLRTLKIENSNESPQNLMISAVLIYNQSIHSTTGFTPFSLLYGPYEIINAHEIDLDKTDKTVYEAYNDKRKSEILPFYEQIYQKQLNRGTKILEKRNKNLKDQIHVNEPAVYVKKQKIRKADPCYEKVNITSISKNKIEGKKEKSKFPANAHPRNIKRLRKTFSLQTNPYVCQPA